MPTVNRDLKITYGSTVVGGTTDYLIDGKIRIDKSYNTTTVSFDVVVAGASSDANFASQCSTLEDAFRTPRDRLLIELGSSTLLDLNPTAGASGNSGFDANPSIRQGS